jgi:hypothetical protein
LGHPVTRLPHEVGCRVHLLPLELRIHEDRGTLASTVMTSDNSLHVVGGTRAKSRHVWGFGRRFV